MNPQRPVDRHRSAGPAGTARSPLHYVPPSSPEFGYQAVELALGCEKYSEILYHASYKSARYWCDKEARARGLAGIAMFEYYLRRLSLRGWGRFSLVEADAASGYADVRLDYSPLVMAQGEVCATKTCFRFAGWFAGMMDWVGESSGRPVKTSCREIQCGADGHSHCIFSIRPKASN